MLYINKSNTIITHIGGNSNAALRKVLVPDLKQVLERLILFVRIEVP